MKDYKEIHHFEYNGKIIIIYGAFIVCQGILSTCSVSFHSHTHKVGAIVHISPRWWLHLCTPYKERH